MIKFKQKEYALPALLSSSALMNGINVVGTGSAVIGLKQGADAAKQQEEAMEQQKRSDAKTRASLEKLAKSGASPEQKSEAASLFSDRRMFAAPGGVVKNLGGLAKDLWTHSGSGVKSAVKMGAGFAAAGYLGNRLVTSLKDHDEGNDKKTRNFLAKAAGTAAAIGGGIWAAKKGHLGKTAKNFLTEGYGARALRTGKNVLKENVSPIARKENGKLGFNVGGAMGLGLGVGIPLTSYLAQKNSKDDISENTVRGDQQRQYAIPGAGYVRNAVKAVKTGAGSWNGFKRVTTGGISKIGNFFGMMGGKGGTEAVQAGAKKLKDIGMKSGNQYTQRLADWAINHPNKANLAAAGATVAVGGAAMGLGEKLVKTPTKIIDRDAYKMEEQENGNI